MFNLTASKEPLGWPRDFANLLRKMAQELPLQNRFTC